MGVLWLSLFCYALLCVHYSFAIKRKRKLVALLILSYRFIFTITVMWLFLATPWVGLQYVIVVFPDHTHFSLLEVDVSYLNHFHYNFTNKKRRKCFYISLHDIHIAVSFIYVLFDIKKWVQRIEVRLNCLPLLQIKIINLTTLS